MPKTLKLKLFLCFHQLMTKELKLKLNETHQNHVLVISFGKTPRYDYLFRYLISDECLYCTIYESTGRAMRFMCSVFWLWTSLSMNILFIYIIHVRSILIASTNSWLTLSISDIRVVAFDFCRWNDAEYEMANGLNLLYYTLFVDCTHFHVWRYVIPIESPAPHFIMRCIALNSQSHFMSFLFATE